MRKRPWNSEKNAGIVLTAILGGRTEPRDPGGGAEQLHDFDQLLDDGRTIAVEETRSSAPGYNATLGAIDKQEWVAPNLTHDWHVGTIDGISVKALRSDLPRHLHALEQAGLDRAILRSLIDEGPAQAARQALFDLGVRLAYQLAEATDRVATIDIGDSARGGNAS